MPHSDPYHHAGVGPAVSFLRTTADTTPAHQSASKLKCWGHSFIGLPSVLWLVELRQSDERPSLVGKSVGLCRTLWSRPPLRPRALKWRMGSKEVDAGYTSRFGGNCRPAVFVPAWQFRSETGRVYTWRYGKGGPFKTTGETFDRRRHIPGASCRYAERALQSNAE